MQLSETFEPRLVRTGSFVRLVRPIPKLALTESHVGVVRGVVPGPAVAYEVEFHRVGQDVPARALLLETQFEPGEGPLLTKDRFTAFRW